MSDQNLVKPAMPSSVVDQEDRQIQDTTTQIEPLDDQAVGQHTLFEERAANSGSMTENAPPILTGNDVDEIDDDLSLAIDKTLTSGDDIEFLNNERRSGRLVVRSQQAILHHNLTHTRIEQLEKQVDELLAIVKNKEKEWRDYDHIRKYPVHLHQLRRCTPGEFALTYGKVRLPPAKLPAIEVSVSPYNPVETPSDGLTMSVSTARRTPWRVVIRSRSLLRHLDDILNSDLLSQVNEVTLDDGTKVYTSLVFLRPFKLLILNEEKIRKSARDLEESMAAERGSTTSKPAVSDGAAGSGNGNVAEIKLFENKDLKKDLDLLIEFLDSDLETIFDLRKKIRNGVDVEVEYDDLWHVFERGDIIVSRHQLEHAFRLLNHAGGRELLSPEMPYREAPIPRKPLQGFTLDCFSLTCDGVSHVPIFEQFCIRRFFGTQLITSLPFFPLKFHPDATRLLSRMTDTGRLFVDITRQPFSHMLVKGSTRNEPRQALDAQVIVDMVLGLNAEPSWRPPPIISQIDLAQQDPRETTEKPYCGHTGLYPTCCGGDSIYKDFVLDQENMRIFLAQGGGGALFRQLRFDEVTEEHHILMRPYVHAFVLRSRQWVTLNVSDLGPVVFESTFQDLRIPDDHKTVIQALVKTHEAGKNDDGTMKAQSIGASMDLVKGKGRGLIILLHGAPGVGKTSTAECVADSTRRPLYPITCGDIGETALDVEKNLQKSFQLAQKWGCVLLLDEADVFLTKRTRSDLRHNAVTSVFLRSLEYYSGILFLTTNRVGTMDLAFKSRIQMTLFYPKLDLEVTLRLYEIFIERARREQDQRGSYRFRIKDKEINQFAEKHYKRLERDGLDTWNGRQIRNAFQTAIALAEYESTMAGPDDPKPTLGKKQFKSVAMGARKFDEYLTSTTGKNEAEAAWHDAWRNDRFAGVYGAAPAQAPPIRSLTAQYTAPEGLKKPKVAFRDEDTESDSETDGSTSDDASNKERDTRARRAGKAVAGLRSPRLLAKEGVARIDPEEEFKQFLEWKKLQQR